VVPEIRFKDKEIHAEDMRNLRIRIRMVIENNLKARRFFVDYLKSESEVGRILIQDVFSSDLIKFEKLNEIKFEPLEEGVTLDKFPIIANKYSLKLRYARHFNTKPLQLVIDNFSGTKTDSATTKSLSDEYWSIYNDFRSITDEASLKRLGPSIIERSTDILTRPIPGSPPPGVPTREIDVLGETYAASLFDKSALCTIALKYGIYVEISDAITYLEYRGAVDKIYRNIKIPVYKFSSIRAMGSVCGQTKKYDELLQYMLFVKDDAFYLFTPEYQLKIVGYICEMIKSPTIPVQEKYFVIGNSNAHEALVIVDRLSNFTPDMKYIAKLAYRNLLVAEIYVKYSYIDEALFELEYIIKSKPPATYVNDFNKLVSQCQARKTELLPGAQYFPNLDIVIEDVTDSANPVVLKDGETVEIFAIPLEYNDVYEHNLRKLNIKFESKGVKKFPPENLIFHASFEVELEDEEYIRDFLKKSEFKFHRGKTLGIKYNDVFKSNVILNKLEDNTNILFKHTAFGGDINKIHLTSQPPYNIKITIPMEIWKKFKLRLYGMEGSSEIDLFYPNISGINEKYKSAFVKFDIINDEQHKYINHHESIYVSKGTEEIQTNRLYIGDFKKELIQQGIAIQPQCEFINIIGCENVYSSEVALFPLFGAYHQYYDTNSPLNSVFNSALISKSYFRDELKTITHEIGHSFALEHPEKKKYTLGYEPDKKYHYVHSDSENCIMNQGSDSNLKKFCENCQILIRNGKVNISVSYYIVGPYKKDH
jgi:hypothetical protein